MHLFHLLSAAVISSTMLLSACSSAEQHGTSGSDSGSVDSQQERSDSAPEAVEASENSEESQAVESVPAAHCEADAQLLLCGGREDITMSVRSAMAVPKIHFNEQTDTGDVAKPGFTICLADFELDASEPWARPGIGQHKVELRLQTSDNRPLETGVYKSPAQGSLQVGPMIYIAEDTYPVLFPKIGKVHIDEISADRICGRAAITTLAGLRIEGAFVAPIVPAPAP